MKWFAYLAVLLSVSVSFADDVLNLVPATAERSSDLPKKLQIIPQSQRPEE